MNEQQIKTKKDCTSLLALNIKDFITAVYRELLEREPDNEGYSIFLRLLYQGMPKEAFIYLIAKSSEFAGRFEINNLDVYKKIYKKFILKTKIERIPVIGWFIKLADIPNILKEIHIIKADLIIIERRLQERLNIVTKEIKENTTNIKEEITYLFDIQYIIDRGLSPTIGFESIQTDFIQFLNDKTDEFEVYNKIPIEQIAGYADGKTVAAAHYSWLISNYASKNKLSEIEAVGIEPSLLPDICQEKDTLIITNPALSILILASPMLLLEIAQKLSRNLVLLIRPAFHSVCIIWEGFSVAEKEEGKGIFRWAQDRNNGWRIKFFNSLARPIEAKLHWISDSLRGKGKLTASCRGKKVSAELDNYIELSMNVILQPGVNNLDFIYSGPIEEASNTDKRILAFRIVNLSCNIDEKYIDQDIIYNKNNTSFSLPDEYIRQTLHQNGFYDVSSTAYANHGLSKRELGKTRYEHPYKYRFLDNYNESEIIPDEIVCYNAYRLSRMDII